MIAAIRSLRQTVNTLAQSVRRARGKTIDPETFAVSGEEAFLSWSNLRPALQRARVDPGIVERLDKLFTKLVRLTTKKNAKTSYAALLRAISEVVDGGLQDFGVKATLLLGPGARPTDSRLIPEISDLPNDLLPRPLLGWLPEMRKFLESNPFENNVFIMTAYRKKLEPLMTAIRSATVKSGLNPVIARDHVLTDDLYNPIACLLCCKYGIAIFDHGEADQKHNANVVYELAVMQILKRKCIILKNRNVPSMPSDFLQKLYEPYGTKPQAMDKVNAWLHSIRPDANN